jgi:endo-1,4-beta-xylanase
MRLDAPARARFAVSVDGRALTVTAPEDRRTIETARPLAAPGKAIGIYVTLEPDARLTIDELTVSQPLPAARELGTPLRQLARGTGVTVGSATDVWPPRHDLGFEALLGEQFDLAAPSEFYWTTTRGEDEDFFTLPADLMINYARVHGQRARGYFLVWDVELPAWLNARVRAGGADALGRILDEHIATLVGRYRGRVAEWVVVNEAIWGPEATGEDTAQLAESIWSDVLGPEYIDRAFAAARAADPRAVLIYNETGAETRGIKSDFLLDMVAGMLERGVPIDGVGLQFHIDAAEPIDYGDIAANMDRFGEFGLGVYITELDVNLVRVTGSEQSKLSRQAEIYAGLLEVCMSVPACRSYTMWGFTDRHAWYEREGGAEAPLVFDRTYQPKPAFFAIQSLLEGEP